MASSLSSSLSGGSEEGFDTYCSPCFDNGISKEAVKYCKDCCVNYCDRCLKTHNKIPLLQGHQIVDKSGQCVRSSRNTLPTEQCAIHQGKLADMFCSDHDTICCAACIAISHRSCVKVDYLPDVAKGIKTSQEFRDVNNSLNEMLNKLNKKKTKRLENLSSLEKEKKEADEEITRVEEELKKKITEVSQQARKELFDKYNERRKDIEGDFTSVERLIIRVTSGKDKLKDGNDTQLFLNVKGGKMILNDGQTLLSSISKVGKKKCLKFVPNEDLQQLNSLGCIYIKDEESQEKIAEVQEYTAKLQGKYKVKEQSLRLVTSVCILDDTTVFIIDSADQYLKRLNMTDFKMVEMLKMKDYSESVCRTGYQEIALALYRKKKIQFISVAGTMTLTRSFSTDHNCYRMVFSDMTGELFVSNNDNLVKVYGTAGNVLKSYVSNERGNLLFSQSGSIALSEDNSTLFLTDWDNGLVALDKSSLRWKYSDQELQSASDICVLPGDVILVSGCDSRNVVQVDKNGKKIGTLLGASENLNQVWALAYHRKTSRLIVGQSSDEIHVYKVSPK